MTSSWALEWNRSIADWARSGSAIWASISPGSLFEVRIVDARRRDPHQLQSIEAGGVLRGLEKRMPTIGLTENRRQRHAWERDALADLRAGEVGRFLTAYQKNGRIHIGDTADSAKQKLISHWSTQLRFKRDVVILALRRDDVADLNRLARGKMIDGRRLGPEALIAGDRVVCLRNQRADGLLNGLRGVVAAIDPEAAR